jgi:Flp pilus assembly protein CpaB
VVGTSLAEESTAQRALGAQTLADGRTRLFLIIGLVLAVLTFVLLSAATSDASRAQQPTDRIDIVVAAAELHSGMVITAEDLERRSYPVDLAPVGALSDPAALVGQKIAAFVPKGGPLVRAYFDTTAVSGSAAATLDSGLVIVAFPTTDALTLAGFVRPGDRIDLLATLAVGTGENAKVTQTTVQSLQVIDVVTTGAARSLVFAVDHQTALVLKYLRDAQASVDVALRSPRETTSTRTDRVDLAFLVRGFGLR